MYKSSKMDVDYIIITRNNLFIVINLTSFETRAVNYVLNVYVKKIFHVKSLKVLLILPNIHNNVYEPVTR